MGLSKAYTGQMNGNEKKETAVKQRRAVLFVLRWIFLTISAGFSQISVNVS